MPAWRGGGRRSSAPSSFAGSLGFLLVAMLAAAAPLAQAAVTAFMVNFRHMFYALSFPLHRVRGTVARTYSTFALTDEASAFTTGPEAQRWSSTRILSLRVVLHLSWVAGATLGGPLGAVLPLGSLHGLDFALSALFIVLAIDAYRARPDLRTAVLALSCVLAAMILLPGQLLLAAYGAFTALLLLRHGVDRRCARRATGRRPDRPSVPEPGHAAVVGLSAAVTWTLRAAPFAVLAPMRDSALVATLRRHMPRGVLCILAAHTLRDIPTGSALTASPFVVAVAVTAGLHLWRRHMLLSIAVGTAVHVALATLLAGG